MLQYLLQVLHPEGLRCGLGNANDLVGRYFMDHPRLLLGNMRFRPQWLRNKLYDLRFHQLNRAVSANGMHVATQLNVAPELQRHEGVLNARIWLSSIFPGEGTAAAEALVRMKHRLHAKVDPHHSFLGDLFTMARQPANTMNFIAARKLLPVGFLKEMQCQLIKEAQFQMICEPSPDPDSRVTLAHDRDRSGMPRVRVNWRPGDQVTRTFDRSLAIVADELASAGIGEVTPDAPLLGREWPAALEGTWHYNDAHARLAQAGRGRPPLPDSRHVQHVHRRELGVSDRRGPTFRPSRWSRSA